MFSFSIKVGNHKGDSIVDYVILPLNFNFPFLFSYLIIFHLDNHKGDSIVDYFKFHMDYLEVFYNTAMD